MLITDVRAHHVRIPYDAGVASFKQGASAIAAIDIVVVEVSTDAGLTGWGDAWGYVCPRSTATTIAEMIAPQARGQQAPDAFGIPSFMERIDAKGTIEVPQGPGLGYEPDKDVMERYRVS